jgi:uroporphyrinogen-III synthase
MPSLQPLESLFSNWSPGMRVLITRPAADATELAAALRAHGHEVLFDPLLTTLEEPGSAAALERSLPGVQAVVFTSPNGVRAFAAASRRRNVPVVALGDATMAAARAAHFDEIESVDGDAEALTSLVMGRLNPLGGALLVVTGAEVGRDLARMLGTAGFSVRRVALYRAEPAQGFSSKIAAGLKSRTIDAAVFFSPGTATVFARLIGASGFASACAGTTAVVTSPAVGAALRGVAWGNLVVARAPTQAAILEAFAGSLPPTRPEIPHQDLRDQARPEPMEASPARSGGVDMALLEPPPVMAPPAPPRLPPLRSESFAPRKQPVARPDGSRARRAAPMLLAVAALLAAVATSPYWAISLAAHLPWVAPGDSGVVLAKVNEINERVAALDRRLQQHMTELDARATGSEEATHRIDAALAEDAKRFDRLDKGLTTLAAGVDSASTAAGNRASSVEEQVRKLEAELGAQGGHLDDLDKGLAAIATGAGNTAQETEKLASALADQRSRLDALDQRLQALVAGTDSANSAAIGRLSALEDQARKLSASLAVESDRLAATGIRVETLAIAIDTANASAASLKGDEQKLGAALKSQGERVDAVSKSTDAANAAAVKLADETQKLGARLTEQGDKLIALAGEAETARAVASARAAGLEEETRKLGGTLTEQSDRLTAVDRRLDTLGAAANSASAADASLGADTRKMSTALADHASRIGSLEKRLQAASDADLANAAASAPVASPPSPEAANDKLNGELAEQRGRLDRLEAMATSLPDKTDVALLFAVDALRARLATSRPFAAELRTAEGLAERRPEELAALHTLDERAPGGIPSLAALVYRFSLVAHDVRDEAARYPPPEQAGAALATAEAALKNEDLASAVSALKRLEPSPAESVGVWIQEAKARLETETALARLDASLARRLHESVSATKP